MCKKTILILVLVICVMSVPMTAGATGIYPTIDDYKIVVEYEDDILLRAWSPYDEQAVNRNVSIGENFSFVLPSPYSRVRFNFFLYDYLLKYSTLIKNATNAWLQITVDLFLDQGKSLYSSNGSGVASWYYSVSGNTYNASSTLYDGWMNGEILMSPCDLGSLLRNHDVDDFYVGLTFDNTLNTQNQYNVKGYVSAFTATLYLQGIDGTDADQFIVITNGLEDIESAVNNVRDEVKKMQGQLDNIDDSINQGFDNVTQKQDTIIDKITSGFANIGNQVKKAVTEAVTDLFVPSEEDMVAQYDKWDALMADRFGAVYESSQIIDSLVDSFQLRDTQETINFPVVSLDIVGTTFEFGGWEVDVIPDGLQWLVDILKLITNIGCTVLFVNGMRSRYESVVK